MTKVKISSQPEGNATNGNDFIERRRASLERYLKRTSQHPVLVLDPDFREFLESGKIHLYNLITYTPNICKYFLCNFVIILHFTSNTVTNLLQTDIPIIPSLLDIELPKATSTSALSSAGVMRLFNKVGETVNKITYKMDETDPVSVNLLVIHKVHTPHSLFSGSKKNWHMSRD